MSYRKCVGAVQPSKSTNVSRRGIYDRAIWMKPLPRRTRWGYGVCWGDSRIVRLWECKGRVVGEDSLAFGQQPGVWRQGLELGIGGGWSARSVDRHTKAIGVDDSVSGRGMGNRLGRVKANPLVYESGSVPGRKRFHSHHGGATLWATEAGWGMGKVRSGRRGLGMIRQ